MEEVFPFLGTACVCRVKARHSFQCEHCGYQVYLTAETAFEKTRASVRDWLVMFLFSETRK